MQPTPVLLPPPKTEFDYCTRLKYRLSSPTTKQPNATRSEATAVAAPIHPTPPRPSLPSTWTPLFSLLPDASLMYPPSPALLKFTLGHICSPSRSPYIPRMTMALLPEYERARSPRRPLRRSSYSPGVHRKFKRYDDIARPFSYSCSTVSPLLPAPCSNFASPALSSILSLDPLFELINGASSVSVSPPPSVSSTKTFAVLLPPHCSPLLSPPQRRFLLPWPPLVPL